MTTDAARKPSLSESLVLLAICALIIAFGVLTPDAVPFALGVSAHIPILTCAVLAACYGFFVLHRRWEDLEAGILNGIGMAMQAILILMMVGLIIGSWIQSGSVPSMIYYGLDLLSPKYFLLASFVICSIVSLATGTSWGTAGTVGIALMGVGAGLGVPPAVTAGICISGGYFGDKMSPLSDTTNLAPAMAGTDLFSHIRAMCWTTGPTYIIVMGIAMYLGSQYASGTLDAAKINAMQAVMAGEFHISLLGFLPPLVVIGTALAKIPALPGLFAGVIVACVMAVFQGTGLGNLVGVVVEGYVPSVAAEIGNAADMGAVTQLMAQHHIAGITPELAQEAGKMLNDLLARGGMMSMMNTIALILCALSFGGIMECCGFLETLLAAVLKTVKSVGGLVTAVIASSFLCNALMGDQYLAIVMPGRMFKPGFDAKGIHPRMLSRSLEDSGTLTSVLIPWNTCGAYHAGVLGVPTLEYAPYAFLNYLNPLMAIALTYMGIGIFYGKQGEPLRRTPEPVKEA